MNNLPLELENIIYDYKYQMELKEKLNQEIIQKVKKRKKIIIYTYEYGFFIEPDIICFNSLQINNNGNIKLLIEGIFEERYFIY